MGLNLIKSLDSTVVLLMFGPQCFRLNTGHFSARLQRIIHQIQGLLMKYPFIDPEDESKDDILKELRLKFKSICATLGLTLVCKGYPKMSDADDY